MNTIDFCLRYFGYLYLLGVLIFAYWQLGWYERQGDEIVLRPPFLVWFMFTSFGMRTIPFIVWVAIELDLAGGDLATLFTRPLSTLGVLGAWTTYVLLYIGHVFYEALRENKELRLTSELKLSSRK